MLSPPSPLTPEGGENVFLGFVFILGLVSLPARVSSFLIIMDFHLPHTSLDLPLLGYQEFMHATLLNGRVLGLSL